jgi:hypothetical protein
MVKTVGCTLQVEGGHFHNRIITVGCTLPHSAMKNETGEIMSAAKESLK